MISSVSSSAATFKLFFTFSFSSAVNESPYTAIGTPSFSFTASLFVCVAVLAKLIVGAAIDVVARPIAATTAITCFFMYSYTPLQILLLLSRYTIIRKNKGKVSLFIYNIFFIQLSMKKRRIPTHKATAPPVKMRGELE